MNDFPDSGFGTDVQPHGVVPNAPDLVIFVHGTGTADGADRGRDVVAIGKHV